MRSTYQQAFDSQRVFSLADRVDLNAYAKANHSFTSSKSSNKAATTYDNKLMHYMPGGGGYPRKHVSTGILPSLEPLDKRGKNFIHQNILQSSRSMPSSKRQDKFEQPDLFQASSQLDNFISQYKQTKNRQSADQILSSRFQDEIRDKRKDHLAPTQQMHSVSLPHLDQSSSERRPSRRTDLHNSHLISSDQDTHRQTERNIYQQRLENPDGGTLSLDLSARDCGGRESGLTSVGGHSQMSPRRSLNKHTMAARDRSGNVVRWIENDTNGRYSSVADYFNEKLKEQDLHDYDRLYGGQFEEEAEKQISGTFGADGAPVLNYKEHVKRRRDRELNTERRVNFQPNYNLQTQPITERPKLYRNITCWRGNEDDWGQSTYNSTFDKSGQSQLDEIEHISAAPLKNVNPKTGLKRVLEVTTNKGVAGKPALYIL